MSDTSDAGLRKMAEQLVGFPLCKDPHHECCPPNCSLPNKIFDALRTVRDAAKQAGREAQRECQAHYEPLTNCVACCNEFQESAAKQQREQDKNIVAKKIAEIFENYDPKLEEIINAM